LSQRGKIVLLATTFSDDPQNANVCQRLAGFKDECQTIEQYEAIQSTVIEIDAESDLSTTLVDPELAAIIAFDSKAAESALKVLAARKDHRRVPMISFDPTSAILDAIEDGRVRSAIYDDPYRSGFKAMQYLGRYRTAEQDTLPVPGHGSEFLVSEVVSKENLADFRRRTRS
jgi:ABC-type sugar transport system substrate-binding protein